MELDQPRRRVLIVAYYFPPIATSGSMRPLGFCRYLHEYGWEAHVLATEPGSLAPRLDVDSALCELVPEKVRVDRVPHTSVLKPLVEAKAALKRIAGFGQPRRGTGTATRATQHNTAGGYDVLTRMKDAVVEGIFEFPDQQRSWLAPAVRRVRRLDTKPDVVLATGGPWTSLLVGQALARYFHVPLVTDFRDPWIRNPFVSSKSQWSARRARALERGVCASASRLVVNTPELGGQFAADYPQFADKLVTITNGFDDPMCESAPSAPSRQQQPGLELCHFGSVYERRDPANVLRAVAALTDRGVLSSDVLRLRFVGPWLIEDAASNHLAEVLEQRGFLRREPAVSHAECLRQMRQADALLILQPRSPLQIPAKIYEYVASTRPIVVVGGEGATAALVGRHRLGLCCANDVRQLTELFAALVSGEVKLELPYAEDTGRFHYRQLTRQLGSVLEAAYQGGHRAHELRGTRSLASQT